jgi:hypothetical protein
MDYTSLSYLPGRINARITSLKRVVIRMGIGNLAILNFQPQRSDSYGMAATSNNAPLSILS